MAYDKEKAHEYYMRYRKKGLKKGRKKGTKKKVAKAKKTSLLGVSTSGLNDNGKIQAGIIKERIGAEMNTALSKAKSPEDRERIRAEYSQKAVAEINALKGDGQYAKEKKVKASSGSSRRSSEEKGSSNSDKQKAEINKLKAEAKARNKKIKKIKKLQQQVNVLKQMLPQLQADQTSEAHELMKKILETLKKLKGGK